MSSTFVREFKFLEGFLNLGGLVPMSHSPTFRRTLDHMNRSDLIQRLAEINPDLPLATLDAAVKAMLDQMTETLVSGGRIEIRGFGSFSTRAHEARQVRNPKTGEKLSMSARRLPHFKPGKPLRDSVNGAGD